MSRRRSTWGAGLLLLMASVAQTGSALAAQELEEVQIIGKKLNLLRAEAIVAQDRYYALFNQLNTDDDYDVHCFFEAPLGTHIKSRVCRPGYIEAAQLGEAQGFLDGRIALPTNLVELMRRDDARKATIAVIKAHPELHRLLLESAEAQRKYEKARKERMKGHSILIE